MLNSKIRDLAIEVLREIEGNIGGAERFSALQEKIPYHIYLLDMDSTEEYKDLYKIIDSSDSRVTNKTIEKLRIIKSELEEVVKFKCEVCEKSYKVRDLFVNNGDYCICDDCESGLEDKTGYCSLNCRLSGFCDQTC